MTSVVRRRKISGMTRKDHIFEWSTEVRQDGRGRASDEEATPVRIDVERMKRALAGPRHTIPAGLSPEEIRQFILAVAREQK